MATALAVSLVLAPGFAQDLDAAEIILDPVVSGLTLPVSMAFSPDLPGSMYIVEQPGRVRYFDGDGIHAEPVVDISDRIACCGEDGLLGIALHPEFALNRWFYIYYLEAGYDEYYSVLTRFEATADGRLALTETERQILRFPQPTFGHNGGQLRFGPDGLLYLAVGDGGASNHEGALAAQRLDTLLGKILRIDVDAGDPYGIPPTNPLVGVDGARPEIWALGLRNPWSFTFDRETGDMWIGDVGSGVAEEINRIPAGVDRALNFGWPDFEGSGCSPLNRDDCEDLGFELPTIEIQRSEVFCAAIVAGHRYRGSRMPALAGRYVFADWCTGELWTAAETEVGWTRGEPLRTGLNISAFGEDAAGELYVIDRSSGTVLRLETTWPRPQLTLASPSVIALGGEPFQMTLVGSGFHQASAAYLDEAPLATEFLGSRRLRATIDPRALSGTGAGLLTVRNPDPEAARSEVVEIAISAPAKEPPQATREGVVNAASFTAGALAPGQVGSIFGESLALTAEAATALPLPTSLGGASVRLADGAALPLLFASPEQINFIVPWDVPAEGAYGLAVELGGARTPPLILERAPVNPAVFTIDQSGSGQAAALIAGTGVLAAPAGLTASSRPARPGEFLEIYATGLGAVIPETPVDDAAMEGLAEAVELPAVLFGDVEAIPVFAGRAPGFVGLYQINVRIPEQAPRGPEVRLTVRSLGITSRPVSAAIE